MNKIKKDYSVIIPDYMCFQSLEAYEKFKSFAARKVKELRRNESEEQKKSTKYLVRFYTGKLEEEDELELHVKIRRLVSGELDPNCTIYGTIEGGVKLVEEDGTVKVF